MKDSEHVLIYDGVCKLCRSLVSFLSDRDKKEKFSFIPLQSEKGQDLLDRFDLNSGNLDTVIYIIGDKYYTKSLAILHVLKDLGGAWKFFFVFIIIPGFIRDFLYGIISKTRYRIFGRHESCGC